MRWFKHDTKFRKESLALDIKEKFGRSWVLTYLYLMEVLNDYKKTSKEDEVVTVEMPMSYWLRELDLGYNQARGLHKLLEHLEVVQCVVFIKSEDMRKVKISNYVESYHSHPDRKKDIKKERKKEGEDEFLWTEDTGPGKEKFTKMLSSISEEFKPLN